MSKPKNRSFLFDIYYVHYSLNKNIMGIISERIDGKLIEVTIQSANLKLASYNTETEDLTVTFNNGTIYEYNKIPWTKFTKFRMAESQGKFFSEHIIKGGHTYKKL
jgi:hypothetical protein